MSRLETFDIDCWDSLVSADDQKRAVEALENGKVLYFPRLPFPVMQQESPLLIPQIMAPKAKNISYSAKGDMLAGSSCEGEQAETLKAMIKRYSSISRQFLDQLIPHYKLGLDGGRTSFRPVEIAGRKVSSYRQDDRLLHVDSFPSTPTGGNRILRIFTNVNPEGKARVWRLGEPFENVVRQMSERTAPHVPALAYLMKWLRITKKLRTPYDHYMLELHDLMKSDAEYQETVSQEEVHFPAGSTWIVFTDQTSHAAMAGQHVLEQTFYLPVEKQWDESLSPLRQLERHFQTALR